MSELQIMNATTRTPIEVLLQVGDDERVSARDTYSFLSPGQGDFARWARTNIIENDFAESGADFMVNSIYADVRNNFAGIVTRELTDYRLSIPFAKKLCMMSRTERGEQAREYFIKVEGALKKAAQGLPALTTNEMILQLAQNAVALEKELGEVKQEVKQLGGRFDKAIQTMSAPVGTTWAGAMNATINTLVEENKLSDVAFRAKLYRELEATTGTTNINNRLTRLRNRIKGRGATYRERMALNKLDVIARDKQLRTVFEGIIKRYQAMYM